MSLQAAKMQNTLFYSEFIEEEEQQILIKNQLRSFSLQFSNTMPAQEAYANW